MNDHSTKKLWTLRYTLLNVTYFAAFCTIHAYAAVYLLSYGFTNTQVGLLLAIANITSALFQPYIAGIIDKQGWLTNRRFILIAVLVIIAGSLLLLLVPGSKVMIFVIYAIIYMIQFAYQPVLIAICFEYQRAGCDIYFGLARGLGSAGFAVTAFFIGSAVEANGVSILLLVTMAAMVISAVVIATFKQPAEAAGSVSAEGSASVKSDSAEDNHAEQSETDKAHNNVIDFAKTYPAFMLFMLATICFFFAHNMINDFLIHIVRNLGGSETQLGYANFLQAILELPVMALIGFVYKKITVNKLLVMSGAAFFVKIMILVFAVHLSGLFISQSFQLLAYAVFVPASAYYVSTHMDEYDQVKGQAYINSAITIGGVFSNLVSGVILDHLGIRPMLIVGSIVCAVGVIIAFVAMRGKAEQVRAKTGS